MTKLSEDQKRIIRLIESEAKAAGVDPDFAIALANLESSFQHIPAHDKSSTAYGPFQVNKATAEANGVDYDEMKKSPELAIKAGILNIARHARNPQLEGDPMRIAAAHRYGEGSEFAKTGDRKAIDKPLASYLASAMEHFPDEQFPEAVYAPVRQSEGQTSAAVDHSDMGSVPIESTSARDRAREEEEQRSFEKKKAAAELGGLGATVGAVKVPVYKAGKEAYEFARNIKRGNVSAKDAEAIIEAANRVKQAAAAPEATTTAAKDATAAAKYTRKMHEQLGLTEREIASSLGMGKGEGEAWDIAKKVKETQKKLRDIGAAGYVLDPERQLMVDVSAGSGPRGAPRSVVSLAPTAEQRAQALLDYQNWAQSQVKPPAEPSRMATAARSVLQSSPVRLGLAGAGVGYNAEDAYQRLMQGDIVGGLTALGATGASAATAVPKFAARANPLAIGLTTASEALGDIRRGQPQQAAETSLTGLSALLPRIFGPLSAAFYSRGLNEGEEEWLKKNRALIEAQQGRFVPPTGR